MHSKVRCKDMHSKVVEAAGCKDCAKLGWSDREYVAVIKGGPRRIGLKRAVRIYRKLTVRRYRAFEMIGAGQSGGVCLALQ